MIKIQKGGKLFLDKYNLEESAVNKFLDCRDGVVECYEYNDESGYGSKVRLFLCEDTKHESIALIRQTFNNISKEWQEECFYFDTDSFKFLKALIGGKENELGGVYTCVRDYSKGE